MRHAEIRTLLQLERPQLRRAERVVRRSHSVQDLQAEAARVLPRSVLDYLEGGAEDERSVRRNEAAFRDWAFVPRWGALGDPDLRVELLGSPVSMPLVLSPTGASRLFHPEGELAVARAAAAAQVPYGLASLSTTPMAEVAAAAPHGVRWLNVEVGPDRGATQQVVDRAREHGYRALLVNVDTRALGRRERDRRNGFTAPPALRASTLLDIARHPRWWTRFVGGAAISFPNVAPTGAAAQPATPDLWRQALEVSETQVGWGELDDLRQRWDGALVLKGTVNAQDCLTAAALGFDAVHLSNHGGRQLDAMASSLDVVAEVREAVGERLTIVLDGGVRRGTDIVTALALGADACAVGRPYLYGLAAAGEAGVARVLQMLREELHVALTLLGLNSVADVRAAGPELLRALPSAREPGHRAPRAAARAVARTR